MDDGVVPAPPPPQPPPPFVMVEREVGGRSEYYVVHPAEPRFSLEVEPELGPDGRMCAGTVRRLCLPNGWAGTYHRQAALIGPALDFFQESLRRLALGRPGRDLAGSRPGAPGSAGG